MDRIQYPIHRALSYVAISTFPLNVTIFSILRLPRINETGSVSFMACISCSRRLADHSKPEIIVGVTVGVKNRLF